MSESVKNRSKQMKETQLPFITIVMPVYNEERFVRNTLAELLGQVYPPDRFEVIVADGGSADLTREVVEEISREHNQVILMSNPRGLPSSGRNIGFKNGKGDLFLVIDGHCQINNDHLFSNMVNCFEKSGAHCLGRPQPLDPEGLSDFQMAVSLARASPFGHSSNSHIYDDYEGYVSPVTNGAMYKREVFEKIGYVDESFDACEDVEFNYRVEKAGFKTYMSPSLAIRYYPRESLGSLFKQMTRYGRGRFGFIRKHPKALNLDMLIPPAFIIGLFSFPFFLILNHVFDFPIFNSILVIWSVLYGFYVLFLLCEIICICSKNGLKYLHHLLSIFITIHIGLSWGFLTGLVHRVLFWVHSSK